MSKRKSNQFGFSAIETLLITGIVIIVVGMAVYVYHSNKKDKDVSDTHSQISQNSAVKLHTLDDATDFVQNTYTSYLAAVKKADNNSRSGLVGLAAVKNNLTPEFYAKAAASPIGEAFSCDGNLIPDRYLSALASYTKTNAMVAVSILNSKTGLKNVKVIIVNVDLARLKITAVDCD